MALPIFLDNDKFLQGFASLGEQSLGVNFRGVTKEEFDNFQLLLEGEVDKVSVLDICNLISKTDALLDTLTCDFSLSKDVTTRLTKSADKTSRCSVRRRL